MCVYRNVSTCRVHRITYLFIRLNNEINCAILIEVFYFIYVSVYCKLEDKIFDNLKEGWMKHCIDIARYMSADYTECFQKLTHAYLIYDLYASSKWRVQLVLFVLLQNRAREILFFFKLRNRNSERNIFRTSEIVNVALYMLYYYWHNYKHVIPTQHVITWDTCNVMRHLVNYTNVQSGNFNSSTQTTSTTIESKSKMTK